MYVSEMRPMPMRRFRALSACSISRDRREEMETKRPQGQVHLDLGRPPLMGAVDCT
jgi:hypothetical protein